MALDPTGSDSERRMDMVTGFDYLSQDKVLQEHWVKRLVAVLLDFLIISVPLWAMYVVFDITTFLTGIFSFLVLFLYATMLEAGMGSTVGKRVLGLKVVPISGQLSFAQVVLRNVSKVFPLFLLLDWIIGMAVDTKDPRQKWMDQIAHTSVITYGRPGGA